METDYYLHNLDVEIGKEMKGYQKSFGVLEWSNGYETSNLDIGAGWQSSGRSRLISNIKSRYHGEKLSDQLHRIQTVRDRCRSQNKALSMWWKIALQINVQQRMVSDDVLRIIEKYYFMFSIVNYIRSGCNLETVRLNLCYRHVLIGCISLKRWLNLIGFLPGLGPHQ